MLRMLLLALATASLLAGVASAQLMPSFGVKGGVNFSNVNLDDLDSSSRTGFTGGLFANLTYPGMHLQVEALYTTKGCKEGTLTGNTKFDYSLHAIQIPVLAKFKLPIPAVAPSIYAGPAIAFTVKSEYEDSLGNTVDIKDDTESSVWSVVFGFDLTLVDRLILDFRYDLGLSAVSKSAFTDLGKDIKDRTLTVMAGVQF